jgi:hypothetical protein
VVIFDLATLKVTGEVKTNQPDTVFFLDFSLQNWGLGFLLKL